ncbi:hypothetical protein [Chryseobacterium koreense]|uniref:Lipocalin-like domain-containing protein n=1 Tax=Chryseobacterium koreense CCUG 49689 TaxID=1304281 RepID=A0A0J7IWH4_9FLAO|nr:hypothetical protein [Chryseobacterium koreense]KMQ70151.1 hypothetical protein ACM44_13840 [Chryseobacterium koreense CCUG 49689]MBB5333944.1 hypothetical protein [Chryseobacterium koreense]
MKIHFLKAIVYITFFILLSCNFKGTLFKNQIIGSWSTNENENVDFTITKNEIEYFDSGLSYKYEMDESDKQLLIYENDKIILKFKVISVSEDSLILKSENDGNRGNIYKYRKRF